MGRKSIKAETYRYLYAYSGNKCAIPNCNQPIFEEDGLLVGECCHIEAYSLGGPRYNAAMTEEERNSKNNLMYLCSRHHKIIDNDVNLYTTALLKEIKKNHEDQFKENTRLLTEKMLIQIEYETQKHNKRIIDINEADITGYKYKIDNSLDVWAVFEDICNRITTIKEIWYNLAISDENCFSDLKLVFSKLGIDNSKINEIPYYENPFFNRNWLTHNIGYHNIMSQLELHLALLKVKICEKIQELNPSDNQLNKMLDQYRKELEDLHESTHYVD